MHPLLTWRARRKKNISRLLTHSGPTSLDMRAFDVKIINFFFGGFSSFLVGILLCVFSVVSYRHTAKIFASFRRWFLPAYNKANAHRQSKQDSILINGRKLMFLRTWHVVQFTNEEFSFRLMKSLARLSITNK